MPPSSTGGADRPEPLGRVVLATTAVVVAFQNQQSAHPLAQARIGEVLGPAPLFRVKAKEREQIMVKSRSRAAAVAAVREAVAGGEKRASRERAQAIIAVAPE